MAGTIKLDGTTFLSKSGSDFTVDVGTDGSYANGSINSNVTFPAGHIIQSVTSVTSDTDSTTSSTYQDSSTSQAITTVATNSKLLITVYSGMVNPSNNRVITTIKRAITGGATTTDLTGGYSDGMMRVVGNNWNPRYYEWVDVPNQSAGTTITYTSTFRNHDATTQIYFTHANSFARISVYEIAV